MKKSRELFVVRDKRKKPGGGRGNKGSRPSVKRRAREKPGKSHVCKTRGGKESPQKERQGRGKKNLEAGDGAGKKKNRVKGRLINGWVNRAGKSPWLKIGNKQMREPPKPHRGKKGLCIAFKGRKGKKKGRIKEREKKQQKE